MPKIDFIIDKFPNNVYNISKTSNLYKFLNSFGSKLDEFLDNMDNVKNSRYVNYSSGAELDNIGKLINLNRFLNESDDSYRGRIKTKIPSFIGGGTISSIKQVIEKYLGITPTIIEHYKSGEGHPYFDNGVFNGYNYSYNGLVMTTNSGISYLNGNKITSIDTNLTLTSNTTSYIVAEDNGNISIKDYPAIDGGYKNLIPPFTSGKWTLHANAKVISDYELELDATDWNQNSTIVLDVLPNQKYVLSFSYIAGTFEVVDLNGNQIAIGNGNITFTPTVNKINLIFKNTNQTGTFTFTNPQLELGSVATPFEPRQVAINLYKIITSTSIDSITDNRKILDPYNDFISNTTSITVQIPYNFSEGYLTIDDTMNILKNTAGAGIALLLKVIGTYDESITFTENIQSYFLVGFSGIGSSNLIGG